MSNFWDFSVWGPFNLMAVLLLSLLAANLLKKYIPGLEQSLIPSSVLGGGILLLISSVYTVFTQKALFDTAFFGGNGSATLEIVTYHALALGFIASTFKSGGGKMTKQRTVEIFNSGVTTVSTYLLQAILGMAVSFGAVYLLADFNFPAAGLLLPFGYGQGTGQALNYGIIYEDLGFVGGRSFGLTVAALGFLSASIGGVIHLNLMRRRGIVIRSAAADGRMVSEDVQGENEIPMFGSMDKMTVQIAFIAGAYLLAFGLMYGLGLLLPGMKSVIFGFNFLLGVLAATLIKLVMNWLNKRKIIRRKQINDFLMTRASNCCFDVMVVAGIAVIRLDIVEKYWGILAIMGVLGAVATYWYTRKVAVTLFPGYVEEQFLTTYGMLTGTASTGIILLREIDGRFQTPAADNMVYQNFPAIVFGFPMMLLATLAPRQPYLTFGILIAFFIAMNVLLFRSKIFGKKVKK
ncbi:MAG: hypothetical protein IKU58_10130 [Clostridia bacterium]|nr:hypothetical protein [Clostridia bacterium]